MSVSHPGTRPPRAVRRNWARLSVSMVSLLLVLAVAGSARADVLVNKPRRHGCVGGAIKTGVWYQAYSGGPRWFRVRILNPRGRVVFSARGRATTQWRYWKFRPHRRGVFRTIYRVPGWQARFETRVRSCEEGSEVGLTTHANLIPHSIACRGKIRALELV